ncbi:MAG: anthranilate synthase component I [Acidobacteria bacterium]|nr:anthranilate synthase component I [Acidobacteriota bacterium]
MIGPDQKEFFHLARQGNVVPVWTSVPADLLTPVSAYLKLTQGRATARRSAPDFSFLLESVEGGETIARYTYMGADPFLILRFWLPATGGGSGTVAITEKGRTRQLRGNLMSAARALLSSFRPVRVAELPPFTAGAVGYLGYDLVSQMEPVPLPASGGRKGPLRRMPDAILMFYTTLLVFDHVKHQIIIIRNVRCSEPMSQKSLRTAYAQAEREIHRIERKLQAPLALEAQTSSARSGRSVRSAPSVQSNFTKEQFLERVRQAKEHIRAGDVFQVVLSQRLETRITVEPFAIYRALRRVNPSPYLFFLRMGEDCVLGSSPEMLVKVSGEEVEYRPIAGTRPRGKDPVEDKEMERELLADEKERAEHVMLVDLGRNDVGRVSRFGTVQVPNLMFVERYSHVMHLVSSVRGKLRPDLDAWDTLWACFPAGTVTGAPKVRAMQIISELEPTRRGVYAGAVLYLDFSGNLNSCITIRTVVVADHKAYIQVGAGIVADSVPEREYEETLNKGKAMLKAIEIAQEGSGRGRRK